MNHSWMSAIILSENSVREDAGVLALVLLEDVGLHRAAHVGEGVCRELLALVGARLPALSRRNASTCWSMAVLRKNARIVGAGPLIVIDTDVVGEHRSKPS